MPPAGCHSAAFAEDVFASRHFASCQLIRYCSMSELMLSLLLLSIALRYADACRHACFRCLAPMPGLILRHYYILFIFMPRHFHYFAYISPACHYAAIIAAADAFAAFAMLTLGAAAMRDFAALVLSY